MTQRQPHLTPPPRRKKRQGSNAANLQRAVTEAAKVNKKKKGSVGKARKKAIAQSQAPKIPGTKLRQ